MCAARKSAVLPILLVVVLLAVAVIVEAQQQAKAPKIGWLALAARPPSSGDVRESLGRELRALGYVGKYRLPGIYPTKDYVDAGGLMSYGVD